MKQDVENIVGLELGPIKSVVRATYNQHQLILDKIYNCDGTGNSVISKAKVIALKKRKKQVHYPLQSDAKPSLKKFVFCRAATQNGFSGITWAYNLKGWRQLNNNIQMSIILLCKM